jgi:hypothetical protein
MKVNRILLLIVAFLASCGSSIDLKTGAPFQLASSTENGVNVKIALLKNSAGQVFLAATFTPQLAGFHLYSMSLPLDGEGRPTLLELPPGSALKVVGGVIESAHSEVSSMGSDALLVYPAGPVTLSLPVVLPDGKVWVQERVLVTYEACSDMTCLTPVVGKLIRIRVPEAGLVGG